MTTASVPSTLVKCLYLFFDLPEEEEEGGGGRPEASSPPPDTENEFTPRERRILLQKMFMQVLPFLPLELSVVEDQIIFYRKIRSVFFTDDDSVNQGATNQAFTGATKEIIF